VWRITADEMPELGKACLGVYADWRNGRWSLKQFSARRKTNGEVVMVGDSRGGFSSKRKMMHSPMLWQYIDMPSDEAVNAAITTYREKFDGSNEHSKSDR
jgi:hypothetical protein